MTTANAIIARAKELGISASLWQKGGKVRIYAKTFRKDMSVYLECDGEPDAIDGAAFKVFCNTQQHPNWVSAQIRDARARFIGLFHAYVVEMYKDTGPQPNRFGLDVNDMIDEARAFAANFNNDEDE